jgi:general secretion pathway protein D
MFLYLPLSSATEVNLSTSAAPVKSLEEALTTNTSPAITSMPETKIYLNFDNAALSSVLNYLIDQKNLDIIPHKDLQNIKVTLVSREPMTIDQAWETVLTLMEANNFTIVTVNGVSRVVPISAAQQNSIPCYSSAQGIEPEDLPDTNAICRYIYFCKNLKTSVAQTILAPLLTDRALQINNVLQACIITDNCNLIKASMRVIKELDVGGIRQAVKVLDLKHTDADQLAQLFNEQLFQQQPQDNKLRIIVADDNRREMSFFSKDTKIFTDPTHNRMIFMGMEDSINKIISFINKYLDVPLDKAQSRIHVYELKHYSADTLKDLLEKMITPPRGQGGQSGTIEGQYKFFEDVVITAESSDGSDTNRSAGNKLIVACNNEDWKRLSAFIEQLDKPQPQIAIEMMIVDIRTDDVKGLGAQFRLKDGMLGDKIHGSSFMMPSTTNADMIKQNLFNTTAIGENSSILSFGDASSDKIWGIIRAMYSTNHTNIISQPYLVVNNNTKGIQRSTVTRRVASMQAYTAAQPVKKYENTPASITTEITPHANASGIIKLNIKIKVDEFKEASISSANTTNREIVTQACMAAGEVLVLGGLTSSKHTTSQWAVPFLSAIPILGNLFKDTSRNSVKNNLYIFIRPTVIKPHVGLGADPYTQLKLDYAKYQVFNSDHITLNKDPIQRHFFSSARYSQKQKIKDLKTGRMPIIDDFAERRRMPNEVEMSRDPFFKCIEESDSLTYEPEEGFASMPHINPETYVAPGLLDDEMNDDFASAFSIPQQRTATRRQSVLK